MDGRSDHSSIRVVVQLKHGPPGACEIIVYNSIDLEAFVKLEPRRVWPLMDTLDARGEYDDPFFPQPEGPSPSRHADAPFPPSHKQCPRRPAMHPHGFGRRVDEGVDVGRHGDQWR